MSGRRQLKGQVGCSCCKGNNTLFRQEQTASAPHFHPQLSGTETPLTIIRLIAHALCHHRYHAPQTLLCSDKGDKERRSAVSTLKKGEEAFGA